MKLTRLGWLLIGATMANVGCGSDGETAASGDPPTVKPRSVSLLVDADRDGYINDFDDAVDKTVWNAQQGASFLANLDDDDLDKVRDADDEIVNGNDADAYDLARIFSRAFADAPAGAVGTITIDAAAAPYVRVFRYDEASTTWTKVLDKDATTLTLTEAEVKSGVQLGIEAKTLVGLPESADWNGFVELEYTVKVGADPVVTETSPEGRDRVRMRVAPWMMVGNSTPHHDTVFSATTSTPFVKGIEAGVAAADAAKGPVGYWKITNWPGDQWTEDYFQTGYTFIPWANGGVAGMHLAMPRPWGRSNTEASLPVNWLKKARTYQDSGYMVVYKKAFSGSTFDSHGNHDLLPPYTNGADSYPYGRIIHGSGVLPETKNFYAAQEVQGPSLEVDTDWLYVGHVDEALTYLPAATPRGWKLVVASPNLAISLLEEWQKQGQGAQQMFIGKRWADNADATVSIDEVLGDQDLMAASQTAQSRIDVMIDQVKQAVGLADDEIVEVPVLFEAITDGGTAYNVAYSPGVVNLRVLNEHVIVPDPFGPKIDGKDGFKASVDEQLGSGKHALGKEGNGLQVSYADDWDLYHRLDGEVHCGTNFDGPLPAEWQWWNSMKTTQGETK